MTGIAFKARYQGAILKGDKTQTIRLWKRQPWFGPGDIVNALGAWGEDPFARLRIVSIEEKFLHEVTKEEARADGYEDPAALEEALVEFYGDDAVHLPLYVIRFERHVEKPKPKPQPDGGHHYA